MVSSLPPSALDLAALDDYMDIGMLGASFGPSLFDLGEGAATGYERLAHGLGETEPGPPLAGAGCREARHTDPGDLASLPHLGGSQVAGVGGVHASPFDELARQQAPAAAGAAAAAASCSSGHASTLQREASCPSGSAIGGAASGEPAPPHPHLQHAGSAPPGTPWGVVDTQSQLAAMQQHAALYAAAQQQHAALLQQHAAASGPGVQPLLLAGQLASAGSLGAASLASAASFSPHSGLSAPALLASPHAADPTAAAMAAAAQAAAVAARAAPQAHAHVHGVRVGGAGHGLHLAPRLYGPHARPPQRPRANKKATVQALEAELREKLAILGQLSAENEMLRLRASVLEATVASREDQMAVVYHHGPPVYPASPSTADDLPPAEALAKQPAAPAGPPAAAAAAGAAPPAGGPGSPAGSLCGESLQPATPRSAKPPAAAPAAACSPEPAPAPAGSSSSSSSQASGELEEAPFDAHTARLPLQEQRSSLERIKQMSLDQVVALWKAFLQGVTCELVTLERQQAEAAAAGASGCAPDAARGASAAEQRVADLVDKASYLVRTAQTLNPGAYCRLFGRNLDTNEPLPYSDAHWRQVVSVLDLSRDQITHILACSELYFSARLRLQNEQRALQAALRAADAAELTLAQAADTLPLLEKLSNNLRREHVLRVMLNSYVWGRIFTHVQKAKAAVYSWPLYVDIHALVCILCQDALAPARSVPGLQGDLAAAAAAVPGPQRSAGSAAAHFARPPPQQPQAGQAQRAEPWMQQYGPGMPAQQPVL